MNNEIINKILYKCLFKLTKKVFRFYNSNIDMKLEIFSEMERISRSINLHGLSNKLKKYPDFNYCVDILNNDKEVNQHFGKLVGTNLEHALIANAEVCITSFIEGFFLKNDGKFNKSHFNYLYYRFEELFYKNKVEIKYSCRLFNFSIKGQKIINFKPNLYIKIKREEEKFIFENTNPIDRYRNNICEYLLEGVYEYDKLIGGELKIEIKDQVNQDFENIIKSLRLFKSSSVFIDEMITRKQLTFHPFGGISHFSPNQHNFVSGKKLEITKKEINELITIWENISNIPNSKDYNRFNIALDRLHIGIGRNKYEDKMIDYIIGLESLFIPDGNTESTFKLSLRASLILNNNKNNAKEDFKFFREMYNLRSRIVHGSASQLNEVEINEIIKLEEKLRLSLKIFLNKPYKFSKNYLNDEIYFI